jgi:hypothetical protein
MFDFKILFAIIFIIISAENVNQVFSEIHVRIAYLFFICACLHSMVIFSDFPRSDWLQQRSNFYDILIVVQKSYILATNRGVNTIFKLETLPTKLEIQPIDTKDSKIQWIDFSGLILSPKCTFSRPKLRKTLEKTNINIEKRPGSALYVPHSAILRKIYVQI